MLTVSDLLDHSLSPQELLDSPETLTELLGDEERGPLVAALVLQTPGLLERSAELLGATPIPDGEATSLWIALAATAERPALDARIDQALDDPERSPAAVDGLVRADVDWHHDGLVDLLHHPSSSFAAAWLLSRSAPNELEDALADMDSTDRIVDCLRAASLAGDSSWFEPMLEWREELDGLVDPRRLSTVDAALATVEPTSFARQVLMGELDVAWLSDDRAVADFLTSRDVTAWCHTLAILRQVRDLPAFELAAAFAVCSAFTEPFEDIDDAELSPALATRWLQDAPMKTALPLAVADDDEFAAHLVEATLHRALELRGLQPGPMIGLPLSGPAPDEDELQQSLQLFDDIDLDDPRHRVALVRTMADLVTHTRRGDISTESADLVLKRFSSLDSVRCLATSFQDERPLGRPDDWGCRGLHRLLWLSTPPSKSNLLAIADFWSSGPPERAISARAFFDATHSVL